MAPSTTRRRLLRATSALVLGTGVAGCNQNARSESTPTDDTTTTTRTTTTDLRARLTLTQEAHYVKAWTLPEDTFRFPKSDVVPVTSLENPIRAAVKTAVESGRYTTANPTPPLLEQVDNVDLVAYNGTLYDVTHTFPTSTISLDLDVSADEAAPDRTTTLDAALNENETLSDFLSTVAPYGTHNPAEPYQTTHLPTVVEDFLERYDYLETPRGVGELVVSRTTRTPPHTISAEKASDRELYGREVHDAADYGPPTRTLIDRVLASDRKTPGNYQDRIHTIYPPDVPQRFARDLDHDSNYVRVGDTVYGFDTRHIHWSELPLEFDASITTDTSADSSVEIRLAVENPSNHSVQLRMTGVAPFGVLWAYGPGGEHVLWNDAYERTGAVVIEDGSVIPDHHDEVELPTGQSASATYLLGHGHLGESSGVQSGVYEVLGTIWARWPTYDGAEPHDWRSQLFPYTLTIEV